MRVFSNLATMAGLATLAHAYIRFDCRGVLVEERADPIVNPGQIAGHVHKIVGGDGFDLTMDYDKAVASSCSTCQIKQDKSNYWTPKLYYQAQNGSFINVPGPGDPEDKNSGMIVYYQQRGPNPKALKAFPKGFRMLAGNPSKRSFGGDFASDAVRFACLDAGKPETNDMPNYNCPNGLRLQIYFPSCWDGENLDSPDHRSHMAYPKSGNFDNGPCPDSHPVQLVSLFFEVLYDTNRFKDMWYGDKHPFVLSNGDTTGYSFHGDFVNGWDVDVLQNIVDNCKDDSKFGSINKDACPIIEQYSFEEMQACKVPTKFNELVKGALDQLPGCNPVTSGPDAVTPGSGADCGAPAEVPSSSSSVPSVPSVPTSGPSPPADDGPTVQGYEYIGCANDSHDRTLKGATTIYTAEAGPLMSLEYCADFCQGTTYFGVQYGQECFCGESISAGREPSVDNGAKCIMKCKANGSQTCGGDWSISLYKLAGNLAVSKRHLAVEKGMEAKARHLHRRSKHGNMFS
ncbi:WSC-domain-containing protein [Eremomyces bilateralis CBS 781.70]|uniref:WSC-domain-containing protein n=1 Tax=Eremomyces bilateralis CBS 781.70 TaxID=1392243 RepID=A0A6G1GAA0_9PEZI|nr:WSC-domain-containing protein [Eremomyces bilateralis CBS 781.70]KAF1814963.1 WSC-domain-containing protein [Eremomyces bilateralis CBS 781.70]